MRQKTSGSVAEQGSRSGSSPRSARVRRVQERLHAWRRAASREREGDGAVGPRQDSGARPKTRSSKVTFTRLHCRPSARPAAHRSGPRHLALPPGGDAARALSPATGAVEDGSPPGRDAGAPWAVPRLPMRSRPSPWRCGPRAPAPPRLGERPAVQRDLRHCGEGLGDRAALLRRLGPPRGSRPRRGRGHVRAPCRATFVIPSPGWKVTVALVFSSSGRGEAVL